MPTSVSVPGQAQGTNQPSPPTGVVTATNEVKLVVQANQFIPFPSFSRGTRGTLLDSVNAVKVKNHIENFLTSFTGRLKTGAPQRAKFEWVFAPHGMDLEIWIPTDLITDPRPTLSNHLEVVRYKIISRVRDLFLEATQGHSIACSGGDAPGSIKLLGNSNIRNYVGFLAPAGAGNVLWTLPSIDGSNHEVLETNGAGVLDWVAAGGAWDINADLNGPDTISTGMEVYFAGTNGISTTITETSTDYWKLRIDHDPSGVTPGTYGNATNVAQITIDAEGHISAAANVAITGGSGAPTDATYVVMSLNSSLSDERVLTAGSGITITDGGANSTVTIATTVAEYVGWGVRGDGSGTGAYVRSDEYVDFVGGDEITTTLTENVTLDGYDLSIDHDSSGVTAGTYGSATAVGQFTVNEFGHITSASDVTITGGGGGSYYWIANGTTINSGGRVSWAEGNGIDIVVTFSSGEPTYTIQIAESVAQHIDFGADGGTVTGASTIDFLYYLANSNSFKIYAGDGIELQGNDGSGSLPAGSFKIIATGAGNSFGIIAVSGQSDVEADQANDTLTLIAGTNITLTTDASGDSVTIAAAGGGGAGTLTIEDEDGDTGTVEVGTDNLIFNGPDSHETGEDYIFTTIDDLDSNKINFKLGCNVMTQGITGYDGGEVTGDEFVKVGGTAGGTCGALVFSAGQGIHLDGSTYNGKITISQTFNEFGEKTAIVKSRSEDADSFVELYCTESPEVRFEDVVVINPPEHCRKFTHEMDPEFVHVCEPDSIMAVGHTTSEPAIAGIRIVGGTIEIEFSELLPVPDELIIHLMGTRAGRAGRRFAKSTREKAAWNASFWDQSKKK